MPSLSKLLSTTATLGLTAAVAGVGYVALRADVQARVYRQRLESMHEEFGRLAEQYNQAVGRTAVTELIVDGDRLSVRVAAADGRSRRVETPFDPTSEIYVDYVVDEGRLRIRRLFDADTPPSGALVLDERLAEVDWARPSVDDPLAVGKAVYRALSDGRWAVSVTGDGSLGLTRVGGVDDPPAPLDPAPEVRTFEELEKDLERELEDISLAELGRALLWRLGLARR
jgi:hypothetical protein